MEFNARQKKTLIYLIGSTLLTFLLFYISSIIGSDDITGWIMFLPPISFGLALYYSNIEFSKLKTPFVIPFLFLLIYCVGTLPFYNIGNVTYEVTNIEGLRDGFLSSVLGCMSAIALVYWVTWLTIKEIEYEKFQILLIVSLPIATIVITRVIPYSLFIAYQLAMTIVIVSSMRNKHLSEIEGDKEVTP